MDKIRETNPKDHMANEVAPRGYVFICLGCGKRSKDRYGNRAISRGWDVSCMLNSILVTEKDINIIENQGGKSSHRSYRDKV